MLCLTCFFIGEEVAHLSEPTQFSQILCCMHCISITLRLQSAMVRSTLRQAKTRGRPTNAIAGSSLAFLRRSPLSAFFTLECVPPFSSVRSVAFSPMLRSALAAPSASNSVPETMQAISMTWARRRRVREVRFPALF